MREQQGRRENDKVGGARHRILVTGARVIPTPEEDIANAGKRPEIPTFPWWAVIAGGVVSVAGVYVWLSGRAPRTPRPTASD